MTTDNEIDALSNRQDGELSLVGSIGADGEQIYVETDYVLDHMFNSCSTDQIQDFVPERCGFCIHGHSTSIRLERAFWSVVELIASEQDMTLPELITRIHDQCLVANDKNIASCLRVICVKYMNIYS